MSRTVISTTVEGLRKTLGDLRRDVDDLRRQGQWNFDKPESVTPLAFHWNGQVDRFVSLRNGPGEFGVDGTISKIRYRWDTPAAANATVEWRLDNTLVFTHTVSNANPHVERPGQPYAQEAIVATVTAVGSDALGLTAFVYLA